MEPFLHQVARIYAENEADNLIDFCFVFPNKRSAAFFRHFLHEVMNGPFIEPAVMPVKEFVTSFSTLSEASRYEQLFILYNIYKELSAEISDFDQFLFWGEMLLNDFNDVDRYLVDPEAIFTNIERYKEISSDYLTPEQMEVIRRYWGEEQVKPHVERFWNHIPDDNDSTKTHAKFLRLWKVLYPLYTKFRETLIGHGLSTQGMFYRNAVACLSPDSDFELPFKRYIFVGFNVLSTSEIGMFDRLKARDMADFYWDANSPALRTASNRATRFVRRNMDEFKSRYPLPESPLEEMPKIEIIGVPSNVGQAKLAGLKLSEMIDSGDITNPDNAIDTAVVLPDEGLFIPMIHSIPSGISSINVTMGFPMKLTPISSLMRLITSLQNNGRKLHGETCFFFENVKSVIDNPIVRSIAPEECSGLERLINRQHLFNIPARIIEADYPGLAPFFTPVHDLGSFSEVTNFLDVLTAYLLDKIPADDRLSHYFLEGYRQAVGLLRDACERFEVTMRNSTFFHLVERAVGADTIHFEGQPLKGLQIMGVLETRALDFRNLILLSMNERIFPSKHFSGSFIPEALRRGYRMATIDFQESIFAYYFYRLISRAEKVTLIYDSRTVGGRTGEMSRYLAQLLYLYNSGERITHRQTVFTTRTFDSSPISVTKTPDIIEKLELFSTPDSEKYLSPSAINTYINCPLQFYLCYVEGLNVEQETLAYMSFDTYGTIVHEVAQHFYEKLLGEKDEVLVTKEILYRYVNNPYLLDALVTRSINRHYNRLPEERILERLTGDAMVLHKVIRCTIATMLQREANDFAPFHFLKAELKRPGVFKVNDERAVNMKLVIDRIDRVNGRLRFVDYKTGDENSRLSSIDDLFNPDSRTYAKGVNQLMIYCHLYSLFEKTDEPIQPIIYNLRRVASTGLNPITIDNKVLEDYHAILDPYLEKLREKILEIFDPATPFRQSTDPSHCKFCSFKDICGRKVPEANF